MKIVIISLLLILMNTPANASKPARSVGCPCFSSVQVGGTCLTYLPEVPGLSVSYTDIAGDQYARVDCSKNHIGATEGWHFYVADYVIGNGSGRCRTGFTSVSSRNGHNRTVFTHNLRITPDEVNACFSELSDAVTILNP